MEKIIMLSKMYDAGRDILDGKVELVEAYCDDPETAEPLFEDCAGVFLGNQPFGEALIRRHPHLRFLAKQGSGFDNIDIMAANEVGLPVIISAGANAHAVAEHVMLLILAANRCLYRYETAVRAGDFGIRSQCYGTELGGKSLGLIGFGRIGRAVSEFAKVFGMSLLIYDPCLTKEQVEAEDASFCSTLDELLEQSDTVSIHVPLTAQTRGMIGAGELSRMKAGSVLVNCSRGGIVDEAALYEALVSGHLRAAGLDVFAKEPAGAENPLFQLDNVIVTPHCAALTKESSQVMSSMTAEGILAVLDGRPWKSLANPEIYHP